MQIQRVRAPSWGIALKTPMAPAIMRSPLRMKAVFMNGPVGPRPSPLSGWLMAEYGAIRVPHSEYPGLRKPSTNHARVSSTGPATAASGATPFLRNAAIGVISLLGQAHLQADPFGADGAGPERTLGGQALELRGRVSAALEHLERPLGHE